MTDQVRVALAALDDDRAASGEIGNARAVICLADGDPAAALAALRDVLDGTAPVIGYVTLVESHLLAGLARQELGDQHAANQGEEISPGELRALRYLPANLSRVEIGSELSVSVNTVSTHIRSIYAKLQVGGRSAAGQRARELRLLAGAR
jgi:DNA-binding NarL/FixJ family response regulator